MHTRMPFRRGTLKERRASSTLFTNESQAHRIGLARAVGAQIFVKEIIVYLFIYFYSLTIPPPPPDPSLW